MRCLVLENLGRTLDAATIRNKLGEYDLGAAGLMGVAGVADAVRAAYDSWQASIERELLDPEIHRGESDEILAALSSEDGRIALASGAAAAGKSLNEWIVGTIREAAE